jgi:hypothetical protein
MNRWIALTLLTLSPGAFGSAVAAGSAPAPHEGAFLAEKLLAAMGGRDAWAKVTFVHVEAVHDDLDIPERFVNRIWNDFSEPRVRFWAGNDHFTSARRIEGGAGLRESGPQAGTRLTAQQYESDRSWWEGNLYRTFHRIAKRDATLSYRAAGPNRLEVLKADGTVLCWFVMNQRGEPMLFGSDKDTRGTAFGPLASSGGVRYPKWGARADGSWRYEIQRFVPTGAVPADAFAPLPQPVAR